MKNYSAVWGSGDPRTFTGLAPTFLLFVRLTDGQTLAPPAITEEYVGTGIYSWQWGTTQPIGFLLDAATTSPGSNQRYITGQLDPADRSDEYGNTMVALGNSAVALGTSGVAIGTTLSSLIGAPTLGGYGSTSADPTTLFGFLQRAQEFSEGDNIYTKTGGILQFFSRGQTTLLRTKTISDTTSQTTKTGT